MMIHSLIFLLAALPLAHASDSTGISCEMFVVDDGGGGIIKKDDEEEEVCAEHQISGPSLPTDVGDTAEEYVGDQVDTYNILELDDSITAEEIEAMPSNYTDYLTGLIVEVTRFKKTKGGCQVTINGTACASCEICDDKNSTSVSADCSAIEGGRAVECEPLDNVYFPFEGYSLADDDGNSDSEGEDDGVLGGLFGDSASHRSIMAALITVVVAAMGAIMHQL